MQRLACEDARIYLHIDKQVELEPFQRALTNISIKTAVHWVKRVKTVWAEFSLVQATLNGLNEILQDHSERGYIILLSGQDYPIKPVSFIREFFEMNDGKNFIQCYEMPAYWEKERGLVRVEKKYFTFRGQRRTFPPDSPPKSVQGRIFLELQRMYFWRKVSLPRGLKLHRGTQWWCLTREAARYMVEYIRQNPGIRQYFQYAWAPDEIIFQTILGSAENRKKTIVHDNDLRYVEWDRPTPPYPAILKTSDLPALETSDKLFARKFDIDVDSEILDLIDNRILSKR